MRMSLLSALWLCLLAVPTIASDYFQPLEDVDWSAFDRYKTDYRLAECTNPSHTCKYYFRCEVRPDTEAVETCILSDGFSGICCADPPGHNHLTPPEHETIRVRVDPSGTFDQRVDRPAEFGLPPVINVETNQIVRFIQRLNRLEQTLATNQIKPDSESFSHQGFFGTSSSVLRETNTAEQVLQAFIMFARSERLDANALRTMRFNLNDTNLSLMCDPFPVCDTADKLNYHQHDGTCNNLIDTAQAKAVSTFARLLPPDYADGVNAPRSASDGSDLPNPRLVSLRVALDVPKEESKHSLLLMQFGQFVDHDLTRTALTRTQNGSQISCCNQQVLQNPNIRHPACLPIDIPEQDLFFRAENRECINFVRSAPAISPKCHFGPREQLNQVSSVIDANQIYGTNEEEQRKLRSFKGGRLKVSILNGEEFLPFNPNSSKPESNCRIPKEVQRSQRAQCFMAGDPRINEVPDLVVLHGVWLREHNRLATQLARANREWSDEQIYQQARKIVIAELQHIIYNEFLPTLLGDMTMQHFGLFTSDGCCNDCYNRAIDPTILNEFSTAAYRLHSLIQGVVEDRTDDNRLIGRSSLEKQFSNPSVLYRSGAYERRLAGLVGQPMQQFDNFFSTEVTNHLFQQPGNRSGLDLVALNIQRGRDHGIPGYVQYRELCGLKPIRSFADLKSVASNPEVVDILEQLYRSVEDIDLFIGGTSERTLPDSVVGPTFACIIGEQFRRLKQGDRFWYENCGTTDASFTAEQLVEIKKVTMSRVICDNSRLWWMQPKPFQTLELEGNEKVPCDDSRRLPRLDIDKFTQLWSPASTQDDNVAQNQQNQQNNPNQQQQPNYYAEQTKEKNSY